MFKEIYIPKPYPRILAYLDPIRAPNPKATARRQVFYAFLGLRYCLCTLCTPPRSLREDHGCFTCIELEGRGRFRGLGFRGVNEGNISNCNNFHPLITLIKPEDRFFIKPGYPHC